MNEPGDFSLRAVNRKRGQEGASAAAGTAGTLPESPNSSMEPHPAAPPSEPAASARARSPLEALPFDPVRLVAAILRGWWKILAAGLLLASVGGLVGLLKFDSYYTATVQIIRREVQNTFRASEVGESFKPRQFSVGTVTAMMRSPDLLAKVGAQAKPRMSDSMLGASLVITPERNTDLITISLKTSQSPAVTANLLNLYANQVVALTRKLQTQESVELEKFLRDQLAKTESELTSANEELLKFSRDATFFNSEKEAEAYLLALHEAELRVQSARLELESLSFRIAAAEREIVQQDPLKLKLTQARNQLQALRAQYTERNPSVVEQEAAVISLEAQINSATNGPVVFQGGGNEVANNLYLDLVKFKAQREALEKQLPQHEAYRTNVLAKLQGLPEKGLHYAKLKARQSSLEITRNLLASRQREAQLFAEDSPGYYRLFAPATPEQVTASSRSTKILMVSAAGFLAGAGMLLLLLVVLETLDDRLLTPGDLRRVTGRRLSVTLGEISLMSESELATWRFRTWSVLQRELGPANHRNVVLGLASARPGEGRSEWIRLLQTAAAEREWRTLVVVNRPGSAAGLETLPIEKALATPQLIAQNLASSCHLALLWDDRWEWNAAQRAKWHAVLRECESLPNVAVLVELPPVNRLESVMLAETLPHVFWLSESGATRKSEVTDLIATLRLAQVNLAGALLNRFTGPLAKLYKLARLSILLILAPLLVSAAKGGEAAGPLPSPKNTNEVFSAVAAGPQLAPWQQRLTLGPGDIVDLSIYGKKQFNRFQVPIGPDGRISYLQASGVLAAGLTIEELRDKLTAALSNYYRHARVIVTPFAWRSKKYYLLGTVVDRGTYYLDQPMTIIEATSRARGIATGLLEHNTVEIADLSRTFLVRQGKRVPVDFVKLFQQGDLSQNVQLEPGDYIYFPSASVNELYVLGAVALPGTVGVTEKASVISVITTRGGFTPKAYKQRVLVVRGSLNQPETHIVDVGAVLSGKAKDFLLQPQDIVYVADRPWARVEELLDMLIKAFIITATAEWVNMNVSPLITEPIFPGL
jgi:protein involved in polysaccharide export with SLBB domain/capsular polysaccharide biosynthesis protein